MLQVQLLQARLLHAYLNTILKSRLAHCIRYPRDPAKCRCGSMHPRSALTGERLNVAAQRSATAIQRLTGAEKYQDYHDALLRLERSANSLRGEYGIPVTASGFAMHGQIGGHPSVNKARSIQHRVQLHMNVL